LPWIGIFKAVEYCNNFVFYDDVQFERKSWQSRNRILNKSTGQEMFLTVPIKKADQKTPINRIEISEPGFYADHIKKIESNYKKTKYRDYIVSLLNEVYLNHHTKLADLNIDLTEKISEYIGIGRRFMRSSDLKISGNKFSRPLAIAQALKTSEYLTQIGTKGYLEIDKFEQCGIKVKFLDFIHPEYDQQKTGFLSHLSIIDVLINTGPHETKSLIQNIKFKS